MRNASIQLNTEVIYAVSMLVVHTKCEWYLHLSAIKIITGQIKIKKFTIKTERQ